MIGKLDAEFAWSPEGEEDTEESGESPPKPADPLASTRVSGQGKLAKQKAQLMDIVGNENKSG